MAESDCHGGDSHQASNRGSKSSNRYSAKRRAFLTGAGATAITTLAGCSGGGSEQNNNQTTTTEESGGTTSGSSKNDFSGETLRVSVWSGQYTDHFRNTVARMYEEETGATIELVPVWGEALSKIRAAPEDNPPYDVTITDNYFYYVGRQQGLFNELQSDIENLSEVYPFLKGIQPTTHGAITNGTAVVMAYKNGMGFDGQRWSDLLKDSATKVTMEGGWYIYPFQVGAITMDDKPADQEVYDPELHDEVWDRLREFDLVKFYNSGTDMWQALDNGVANIAQTYYAFSKRKIVNEGLDMTVAYPEVTNAYFDWYAPVRGTDKQEMGEHFINFMLREDVQTEWATQEWSIKANKNTTYPETYREDMPQSNEAVSKLATPRFSELQQWSSELNRSYKQLKSEV